MKEFFVGMFLVVAFLLSPLTGAFRHDDEAVPMLPDSINDDADPVGSVSDPGRGGEDGSGKPNAGRGGQKRTEH